MKVVDERLTKHSCLIFAEIVDAAILPVSKIVKIAKKVH